jgi:trehalose-phosphatase
MGSDNLQNAPTLTALEALLQQVETAPASVLLLDYDGTLAPFHVDRNRAYPYPGVVPLLESIVQSGRTKVVIISGRPLTELQKLLAPISSLEMWGSHGMERRLSDGTYRCAELSEDDENLLEEAERRIAAAGLLSHAEIKLGGIAVHWRGLQPDQAGQVLRLALREWESLPEKSGLKLLQFEAGLELRVAHPNKGDAVRAVLEDMGSDVPSAFLGDDLTDEDAFRVLNEQGLSILVRDEYRQTTAAAWIKPPHQLIDFFERWLGSVSK